MKEIVENLYELMNEIDYEDSRIADECLSKWELNCKQLARFIPAPILQQPYFYPEEGERPVMCENVVKLVEALYTVLNQTGPERMS